MLTYHIISAIKIILWIICITLVNYKIYPDQDMLIWAIWILIWIFLIFWGISYFIFYLIYMYSSHKKLSIIASQCYKVSFLIWVWWFINFGMIFWEMRNIYIWLAITIFFAGIAILMFRTLNYKFDNITEFIPEKEVVL